MQTKKMKMAKNKIFGIFVAVLVLCTPVASQAAWATVSGTNSAMLTTNVSNKANNKAGTQEESSAMPKKSPTQAIKDLDGKLDDFKTGKKLTDKEEEHNRQIKMDIIHGTFDIAELSKLALAKHWNGLDTKQRDHFVDLMISLLEEKALFSKEQSAAKSKEGGKYKVIYRGHEFIGKDKSKAFVRTKVVIPSENIDINLNYKLKVKDGQWKIYDVIVDEASLVANYKYQFNSIITKHGYDELVSRMTRKLNEIKEDREQKT